MSLGLFYSFLLGLIWACVGGSVALARRSNAPIWRFYMIGATVAALLCWMIWFFQPIKTEWSWILLLCLSFAALFNCLGQAITMYNLKAAGRTLAFALPQTNFIFPFLFAGFFLNGTINSWNVTGILLITVAIFLSTNVRKTQPPHHGSLLSVRELMLGIASSVLCGISQIFLLLSAEMLPAESPFYKSALLLSASVLFFGIGALREPHISKALGRKTIFYGTVWGIFAMISYWVLFQALGIMGKSHQAGVVFAFGCSIAIVAFWLFSMKKLKECPSLRQLATLGFILAGIIAVRLG